MIAVKEVFKINKNATVLVCDMFSDDVIKEKIQSNMGQHEKFEVETPRYCFSEPKTRNIVLFGHGDFSDVKTVKFI